MSEATRALFVSDVHLSASRPDVTNAFIKTLARCPGRIDDLYLLGDIFDEWLGDDDDREPHVTVAAALAKLTDTGARVAFMVGNHDFLVGERFLEKTGARLLPDPFVMERNGQRALLMHGDSLCTDDIEYQAFRIRSRDPEEQRAFLAQPLKDRIARVAELRKHSRMRSAEKPEAITDVTASAVARALRDNDADLLVHGHTHRPNIHELEFDGRRHRRIVLGDWYHGQQVLLWQPAGMHHESVNRLL